MTPSSGVIPRLALIVLWLLSMSGTSVTAQPASDFDRTLDLQRRSLDQRAARWRCEPASLVHCSGRGCEPAQPSVWVLLDFGAKTYERCDQRGCDRYPIVITVSGIYTVVTLQGGAFLKALNDGSEFVDVASSGTALLANFGRCTMEGRR